MDNNLTLSRKEVATLMRVTYGTVFKWEKKGWIKPAYRTAGGHPRFTLEEIERATVEHKREEISPCNS